MQSDTLFRIGMLFFATGIPGLLFTESDLLRRFCGVLASSALTFVWAGVSPDSFNVWGWIPCVMLPWIVVWF